jgi:hypothetical protein
MSPNDRAKLNALYFSERACWWGRNKDVSQARFALLIPIGSPRHNYRMLLLRRLASGLWNLKK